MPTPKVASAAALFAVGGASCLLASNHREAPITALDRPADITDMYAFVSYDGDQTAGETPETVTFILCVDPLIEPANGPNWAPFDDEITYRINIDNDHDAVPDVQFDFEFSTEYQLPGVYTALAGFGESGARDPETNATVVPPEITSFSDVGLNTRQNYSVTMTRNAGGPVVNPDLPPFFQRFVERRLERGLLNERQRERFLVNNDEVIQISNNGSTPFYAAPANAGPRTMDYDSLFAEATYSDTSATNVSVFAGTVDDPFFIDLGAAFDTANFRTLGSGVPGVLTEEEDAAGMNFASDTVSGYAVNAIAIQVPIEMLTSTGEVESADDPAATLGIWGATLRPEDTVRRTGFRVETTTELRQVQRFGNPLINELIIGTGSKDRYSMDQPVNDSQFSDFYLDPPIVQIVEALYNELAPGALDTPEPDRTDLLLLVQYLPPIAAEGTPTGPIADMMRLNTGVPATPLDEAAALGVIGGDLAGFPNGRRLYDDVVDITLRVGVGGILIPEFNVFPNNALGDGVNVNDAAFRMEFPYLASCPSGRDRRHIDPGETFADGRDVPID